MSTQIAKRNETAPVVAGPVPPVPPVVPTYDVYENDQELLLAIELPGIRPDSLRVQFEKGAVRVSASRWAPAGGRFLSGSPFDRRFEALYQLPVEIEADQAAADLRRGVLELHLPKSERAKPRRIPVRSS